MQTTDGSGILSRVGVLSVDDTVAKIKALLAERQIELFALIDHSGEAARVGLEMPPTKLLIFGNPRAGTPVMLQAPLSAIDLPLKLLVSEDADGRTRISWNDAAYLRDRHHLPAEMAEKLGIASALAELAAAN